MEEEFWQDEYIRVIGNNENTYADNIFLYQKLDGFLPVEIQRINGRKEYVFYKGDLISLESYLKTHRWELEFFRRLFEKIFLMKDCLKDYLLDQEDLVLRTDLLFISLDSHTVYGICVPDSKLGTVKCLGKLLEQMMQTMDAKNKALAFSVYELHKMTREKNCTHHKLREFVQQQKEGEKESESVEIPIKTSVERPAKQLKTAPKPAVREYLPAIGVGLAGIVLFLLLWGAGIFKEPLSGALNVKMFFLVLAVFFLVSGYGVWKLLPERKEKKMVEFQDRDEKKVITLMPQKQGEEPVSIRFFPCQIGREKDRVDIHIQDERVSRIHAQLVQEGEQIMIMDEESANGTYRNDNRLVPWQKTALHNEDRLRFAQTEYQVQLE